MSERAMVLTERNAALRAPGRLRLGFFVGEFCVYLTKIPATLAGISFRWRLTVTRDKFQHALGNESLPVEITL